MFMQSQCTDSIVLLSTPPQPIVNTIMKYRRCGRLITGKLLGTHWYQVERYNAVVCEYIVEPSAGQTNLSFHVVAEDDIVWSIKPVCPRCNGERIIGIVGDNAIDCPECGFIDEWRVF